MKQTILIILLSCIVMFGRTQDQTHTESVSFTEFSPDGRFIVTGSYYEDQLKIWSAFDGTLLKTIKHKNPGRIVFSQDGSVGLLKSEDSDLTIISFPGLEVKTKPGKHIEYVIGICKNNKDFLYYSMGMVLSKKGGYDYKLRDVSICKASMDDPGAATWKKEIGETEDWQITAGFKFSGKTNRFIFSQNGIGYLCEVGKDEPIAELKYKKIGAGLVLSPDGEKFIATKDGKTSLYSFTSMEALANFQSEVGNTSKFSQSGDTIFYMDWSTLRIFDCKTGESLYTVTNEKSLYYVSYDPKGRFYAGAPSGESLIGIFDLKTGERKFNLIDNNKVLSEEDIKKEKDSKWAETHYNREVPKNYQLMNTSQAVDFYGYIVNHDYMGKESYIYVAAKNKLGSKLQVEAKIRFEVKKSEYGPSSYIEKTTSFVIKPGEVIAGGDNLSFKLDYKKEHFAKIEVADLKVIEVQ